MTERANRLKELRLRDGVDMTALAAELGKSHSTYVRYESGSTAIPDEIKLALAERYGVTVEHLMGWDVPTSGVAA